MMQGKSLEKVLTLSQPEYERYLKASETPVSDEERRKPETYAFGQVCITARMFFFFPC